MRITTDIRPEGSPRTAVGPPKGALIACLAVLAAIVAPARAIAAPLFHVPVPVNLPSPVTSLAAGDLNSDGWVDLMGTCGASNKVLALLGGPGGSFGPPIEIPVGLDPRSIAIKDLDGDGHRVARSTIAKVLKEHG